MELLSAAEKDRFAAYLTQMNADDEELVTLLEKLGGPLEKKMVDRKKGLILARNVVLAELRSESMEMDGGAVGRLA
jgi:hypothetical protein